ncbi:MAG TPA: DUF4837 family protein [Bacteroidetes bacterium]|nr:DUF4837 family protein [Bacteroidota bacterium]
MKHIAIIAFFSFFIWSCASEPGSTTLAPNPADLLTHSYGKPNQIMVVADSTLWQGPVGDTFFYYFAAPFILLTQPEPIFDIIFMTPEDLAHRPAKKEFKTIFFLADLSDENSITSAQVRHDIGAAKVEETRIGKGYKTIVGQNKWAREQQLFYIIGFGENKLAESIGKNFAPIARRITEKDIKMIEHNAYQSGVNEDLQIDIAQSFGVNIKIPGSYKKILYNGTTNTVWLRSDDRELIANLIIHKRKYKSKDQLTREGIKAIQNEVGRIITTQEPNTYMRINDEDLPLFIEKKTINNLYTVQAKGIWDIVNDFKGGAFISNLMLDPEKNELIFVDGFIYAPAKNKKRDYMQEMGLIVNSAEPVPGKVDQ